MRWHDKMDLAPDFRGDWFDMASISEREDSGIRKWTISEYRHDEINTHYAEYIDSNRHPKPDNLLIGQGYRPRVSKTVPVPKTAPVSKTVPVSKKTIDDMNYLLWRHYAHAYFDLLTHKHRMKEIRI